MIKSMCSGIVFSSLLISSVIYADGATSFLKPSAKVAPFKACFVLNPKESDKWSSPWYLNPQDAAKVNNGTPVCYDQNTSVDQYKNMSSFEKAAFVATAMWQYYWTSDKPIQINFQPDSSGPRFGGLSVAGLGHQLTYVDKNNNADPNYEVYPPSALSIMGGNQSAGGVVINVYINQQFGLNNYCFDPTPSNPGKPASCDNSQVSHVWDVTSVLAHELGHGYGFASIRDNSGDASEGDFYDKEINLFDFNTNNQQLSKKPVSGPYCMLGNKYYSCDFLKPYADEFAQNRNLILFTGANTVSYLKSQKYKVPANGTGYKPIQSGKVYGAAICNLMDGNKSQNFSHFSTTGVNPPKNPVTTDLMSLWLLWNPDDGRLDISSLDLNVMKDLGYPVKTTTALNGDDLRKTLFNNAALGAQK